MEEDHYLETSQPNLMVFDDLMGDVAKDKRITELFTKGCHHRNLSVICLVQNFYFPGTVTMRRNCHYLVLFDMPGDKKQISSIAHQMYPEQPSRLLNIYRQCTSKPYGYLVIDLGPQTEARDRLKTDIFAWKGEKPQTEFPYNNKCAIRVEKPTLRVNWQPEIREEILPDREEKYTQTENNDSEMEVDDINEETLSMDQTESEMQKTDSKKEDGKHCPDCGTVFRTPFDLVLHMKEWCPATYPSSRKRRRVEVEEEEKPKDYGFEPLLEAVHEELAPEEEEEAPDLSTLNRVFRAKYRHFLETWYKLQDNPIHQKVMSSLQKLLDDGDYSQDEAIAVALRERKYLFDDLFEESEEEDEEEEGTEEEEEGEPTEEE